MKRATRFSTFLAWAISACLPVYSIGHSPQNGQRGLHVQSSEAVSQLPLKSKRWALIIGIDEYKDKQISALNGAANDARMLADTLIERAGFPADQVIVLATDQPEERQPTRVNILRRLSNLAAAVPKDGLLLVSFAGHGMERNQQAFLLPSDAQISDDVSFLEETALSVTRIRDRIKGTGVQQVVMLLDACRNDPAGRADAPNKLTEAYTRGFNFDVRNKEVTAFATIYATAVGERAYEYTEKRQGYFTWAIVEGIKGGAANERGEVTLARLVSFVQEAVPKRILIDLGAGKQQRPFVQMDGYKADELVIAVARVASPTTASTTGGVDPAQIELSFWDTIKNSANPEEFKAYLQQYPNGRFAAIARIRAQTNLAAPPAATAPTTGGRPGSGEGATGLGAAATHFQNGNNFLNQQKHAEAETEYRAAINLDPRQASYHGWLGVALGNQRKDAAAEAAFREAIRLDPKESWYHYSLAVALGNLQRPAEQEAEYREAIRLDPGKGSYHLWLGALLGNQQRHTEAEAEFRRAIGLEPNQGYFHYNLGLSLVYQKRFSDAEAALRQAVTLEPNQASYHASLGGALFSQNRFADAEAEYRQATRLNPYDASYHGWLASALQNQQKWTDAEAEYREALKLDSNQGWFHGGLGSVLFFQARYRDAELEYREAIRLSPNATADWLASTYGWLGSSIGNQQRPVEAEAAYRHAISLDPTQPWLHTGLGYALELQNRRAEAESEYSQALRLNPNDTAAQQGLRRLRGR
ncbi:MAG TPA: tetratricopeptide repeat protein [Blastocatellia bacterium]|nr:tetratricopeptide repeat protein [Blastocatellia bacterium]